MSIRLVTFDALHTILTPRLPIYVQYSQAFEPYLGVLDPDALKKSFKAALKHLQVEKPVYQDGAEAWWGDVIRRTATGAGANPQVVDKNIGKIVPRLLHRFSSKEGYKLFDDALPSLERLRMLNVRTGLVSNTDARMRAVLDDLNVTPFLNPLLLSEEQGIEKPSRDIYIRACNSANVEPKETLHIGDELQADYHGARNSGLEALLIRRPGPADEGEAKEDGEEPTGVGVVSSLQEVVDWVRHRNETSKLASNSIL